ncbi:MAG: twin-arginine translocation signal domain-containing protein, partial [Rhizobiaceae bacterium]
MLRKKVGRVARGPGLSSTASSTLGSIANTTVDRRSFLKKSGLAVGGLAAVSAAT